MHRPGTVRKSSSDRPRRVCGGRSAPGPSADEQNYDANDAGQEPTPRPPPLGMDTPMEDLHWDGELAATLVMGGSGSSDSIPRIEGSFSVAAAWKKAPKGNFTMQPFLARGNIRAAFGGSPSAPTRDRSRPCCAAAAARPAGAAGGGGAEGERG